MNITKSKHANLSDPAIEAALGVFGVPVTAELANAIRRYMNLLLVWNQKVSLTSIIRPEEILVRHLGESMFAARAVPIWGGRLVDIGAGAGFPGLALKLLLPQLRLTLIEANKKKAAFLKEVVRRVGLSEVRVLDERLEHVDARACVADFVTARAVGNFDDLLTWSGRALDQAGKLVLWLGRADAERVREALAWEWAEPISIPRSVRRVLLVGTLKQE